MTARSRDIHIQFHFHSEGITGGAPSTNNQKKKTVPGENASTAEVGCDRAKGRERERQRKEKRQTK